MGAGRPKKYNEPLARFFCLVPQSFKTKFNERATNTKLGYAEYLQLLFYKTEGDQKGLMDAIDGVKKSYDEAIAKKDEEIKTLRTRFEERSIDYLRTARLDDIDSAAKPSDVKKCKKCGKICFTRDICLKCYRAEQDANTKKTEV